MIKNYLQLNEDEKNKVHKFINRNNVSKKTFEENEKTIIDEIYDFGEGCLFLFKDANVIGKANVILKECKNNGNAYIIGLDILENTNDKMESIKMLINKSKSVANDYDAENVYIGLNDEQILDILRENNIKESYLAITMKLLDNKIYHNPLKLKELSKYNRLNFKKIHDEVFLHIPNGGSISEEEIDERLQCKDSYPFIVMDDYDNNIGILDISITNGIGCFDLGLIKDFRGKGYGKRLLDTAIDFLNSRVDEINLLVISKNTLAYEMYKKRGFVDKEIYSYWYEVNENENWSYLS